jgi:subtilisin
MSEQNRDQGQSKQTAHSAPGAKFSSPDQPKTAWENGAAGTVASRKPQYLIGSRALPGAAPVPTERIVQALDAMGEVEIVRRLRPRGSQTLSSGGVQPTAEIIIARMDEGQGEALRRSAVPNLVVEPDELLHCGDALLADAMRLHIGGQMMPLPCHGKDIAFRVLGEGDRPLAGAGVTIFGGGFPAQAVTDASGQATVTFYDEHNGSAAAAKAVYVRPAADHWERFIADPALGDGTNLIRLRPLSQTFPKFPGEKLVGWGQRMMKLDQLADGFDGAGVRIGLIGTGCDNTHPLLRHVTHGLDVIERDKPNGWTVDSIGHGTHCAGIIAAVGSRAEGVRGFAPGAELHIFKLFPGGRFSDLIEALDECIERQIDVVHIGVGSDKVSELVASKLTEARQRGLTCIAAAGGPGLAQLTAITPSVLAVSAVGKLGEFPSDSYHAQTALGQPVGAEGLYIRKFSGYAPEEAVYAPGVAIVSTVPGGGYAAWDGSSIAAAHVTGFAALLLAHYPLFRGAYATRSEHRAVALCEAIRVSSDPTRVGGGLANFQQVPGWDFLRDPAAPMREAAAGGMPQPQQPAAVWATTSAYLGSPVMMQLRALGMV